MRRPIAPIFFVGSVKQYQNRLKDKKKKGIENKKHGVFGILKMIVAQEKAPKQPNNKKYDVPKIAVELQRGTRTCLKSKRRIYGKLTT